MSGVISPLSEAREPYFVGVDLGGTNVKVGLVDDQGLTLAKLKFRTESEKGPEDGARRMGEAVRRVTRETGIDLGKVARVGLGTPGTMDIPAGMLVDPPNLPGWANFPIRDRVQYYAGRPVTYVNDGTAAAYGEYWVGTGRHHESLVLFTLGTGIGCGIIIDDMPIHGQHSHGAECGHIIVNFHSDARVCSCGQTGHVEAYASALSIIKRTQELLHRGRASSISDRLADGEELTPWLLWREAEKGDELSLEIILDTARYVGFAVVNLMNTIDPDVVVLGGAMNFGGLESAVGRGFLDRIRLEVRRRGFPIPVQKTRVDFATLGGDAGYIGAAGLARREHQRGTA